jgi:hypothetical protein
MGDLTSNTNAGGLSPFGSTSLGVFQGGKNGLAQPFGRTIFLFETHIAGTSYVENIAEIEPSLKVDDVLTFVREPKNERDELAILIRDAQKRKLGYVPRRDNPVFARLMDAGKRLFGKIRSVERVNNWLKIEIGVYLDD